MDELAKRAIEEKRRCELCELCEYQDEVEEPQAGACGWRVGMLLREHRPWQLGAVLQASHMEPLGVVWTLRATAPGWHKLPGLQEVARGLMQSGMAVLIVDSDGEVRSVFGSDAQLAAVDTSGGAD
ncbi:MAG: hypothetical protein JSV90_04465 [Methanobacteriota archaeon]|nr:MAG: hypothetical protein JSV90_04465 [Euryarchaeota archaeon]